QPLGLRCVDLQQVGDEGADALVDLVEQVARGRVERVVEIEDPAIDVVHGAGVTSRDCAVLRRQRHTLYPCTSVPTPCEVKISSISACGRRPSRMTAASTPWLTASTQVSSLGIMPPEMVPSAMSACTWCTDRSSSSAPVLSSTPATSVSISRRAALTAAA